MLHSSARDNKKKIDFSRTLDFSRVLFHRNVLKYDGIKQSECGNMENIEILFGAVVIISAILYIVFRLEKKKYIDTDQFEKEKIKIKPSCSEEELDSFIAFLKVYKGGYIKRRDGKIVNRDYLGKEKGDLKGIFYHIVVPSNKLSIYELSES